MLVHKKEKCSAKLFLALKPVYANDYCSQKMPNLQLPWLIGLVNSLGNSALLDKLEEKIGCSSRALGMEGGDIPDSAISASSTFDQHSVGAHFGRVL